MRLRSYTNWMVVTLLIEVLFRLTSFAQPLHTVIDSRCRIAGRITDRKTGEPLQGAMVFVEGTKRGAWSNDSGNYCISEVSAGIYVLQAHYVGYVNERKDSVYVFENKTTTLDFLLKEWCETWADSARADVNRSDIHIYLGQVLPDLFYTTEGKQLTHRYGFEYRISGCDPRCYDEYNEAVYDYLEKKNGKGWRERFDEECKKLEDRYHYKKK